MTKKKSEENLVRRNFLEVGIQKLEQEKKIRGAGSETKKIKL